MARVEIEARALTPAFALRVLLANDQRLQQDGDGRSRQPGPAPPHLPPDMWRLLFANAAELRVRRTERTRDRDQVERSVERLATGKRISANALYDLGGMVEAGVRILLPPGAGLVTSLAKGIPRVAPNIRYQVDDALALVALAVLTVAGNAEARGRLGRCKECGGLFVRPAAPRGHRRREFCPGSRCGPRYHERVLRARRAKARLPTLSRSN